MQIIPTMSFCKIKYARKFPDLPKGDNSHYALTVNYQVNLKYVRLECSTCGPHKYNLRIYFWDKSIIYLVDSPPNGVLKHGTPLCLLLLKACAVNLASDAWSILQNEPLPGSSWERGTFTKYRFRDKLCLIEFWKEMCPRKWWLKQKFTVHVVDTSTN